MEGIAILFKILLMVAVVGIFGIGYSVKTFFVDSELEQQAKAVIEACERDLPRTQKCKLTAVAVKLRGF
ncbi:hypothetical protein [Pseudoalteromonas ruthenica]|uniref:hypothetical protein n=1 Tax=Pseudoalteromonas ruthenica TaxID=151081 RepID=UPI00110BF2DB|nr:hypothetical protein [Pseudoalteromonas ruthenica]TMO97564.1 hypothetical protein CWC07_13870 [Pseudoalteromonas ruthenica]